jgi:hypothetical protein
LAPKQHVEQGIVGHFTRADVANDGERISEEENKESGADNNDSVNLEEVFDQRWTDERSIWEGGVIRLEIVYGHPGVVLVEIANDSSGSNFDQKVWRGRSRWSRWPRWSGWSGWSGRREGGHREIYGDIFGRSAPQANPGNKYHGGSSRG